MANIYLKVNSGTVEFYHDIALKLTQYGVVDRVGLTMEPIGGKGLLNNPKDEMAYLKEQQEVDYYDLTYTTNIIKNSISNPPDYGALERYEKEFGDPWLQFYLNAARDDYYGKFTFEEKRSIIQGLFDYYIRLFENFNPDIFVASSVASPTGLVPFDVVRKKYNGESFWWMSTRIQNYYSLANTPKDTFPDIVNLYQDFKSGTKSPKNYSGSYQKAINHLENFRSDQGQRYGDQITTSESPRRGSRPSLELVKGALNYHWIYRNNGYEDDFKMTPTHEMIKREISQIRRRRRILNSNVFQKPRFDRDYIYFPLHYQNEWSTLVLAPMYLSPYNQLSLIQQISRSLPINYYLYVKAHPTQLRKNPHDLGFYREIDKLHNVKLIPHHVDSHNVIKNSIGVATITGTSGLEGMFYDKPVITFGNPSYHVLEGATRCYSPENISKNIISLFEQNEPNDADLINYLTAVFENALRFNSSVQSNPTHKMYDENLESIFTKIRQKVTS